MYFRSLQVLRGWWALAVVLYHLGYYAASIGGDTDSFFLHFDVRFSYGGWFFFVLSGFLMSYLIDTGYRSFLARRLVRVFPSFWLTVIVVVFGKVLVFGSIDTPGLWKAMLLAPLGPSVTYPLGVEWTLVYEVCFYVVCAAFANDALRRLFPYFLAGWLAILVVAQLVYDVERAWFTGLELFLPTAVHWPLSPMNELFIAGGLSYYAFRRLPPRPGLPAAMLVSAALLFMLADVHLAERVLHVPHAYAQYAQYTLARLSLLALCFSLLVVAVCLRERRAGVAARREESLQERFGNYSYALYMIHVPVITVLLHVARWKLARPVDDWICLAALASALVAGWWGGKLDVWLHRHFKRRWDVRRAETGIERLAS